MVGTRIDWQLPTCRPSDLAMRASGDQQLPARPVTDPQLADVHSPRTVNGVRLQWRGVGVYAMSDQPTATTAAQGDRIAVSDVHVTDNKFSTRLGPPPLSPPV